MNCDEISFLFAQVVFFFFAYLSKSGSDSNLQVAQAPVNASNFEVTSGVVVMIPVLNARTQNLLDKKNTSDRVPFVPNSPPQSPP
jgi:hypothetical protein